MERTVHTDPEQAIAVDSVEEEYAIIAAERCACGGRFHVVRQSLVRSGDRSYDLLEAICQRCGQPREFLFDVSAFFGKTA